jgi:putative PIG3 family NAD(P)H quinone oxidoreductase
MRAVVLHEHGGPEVLTLEDVPAPEIGPDEVLVEVRATALNRADLLQRMGLYPSPVWEEREIPGLELAGTVVEAGRRVTMWQPGDAVMGIVSGGAYAELVAVHERQLLAVPAAVGLDDAAAIPEVFLTAWDALVVQGGLTSGRWALVHAGASGVGTAAIQLAKAVGARVAVTCSAGKVEACRALGADAAIDYRGEDFVEQVRALTDGQGADVVLDVIGGDYVERNLQAVAVKGRIVQVGLMAGGAVTANVGLLLPKRLTWIGTVLRARPLEEKVALTRRFASEVLPLFAAGVLRPVIDSRYALDRIAEAHRAMETNANVGKILVDVLTPG